MVHIIKKRNKKIYKKGLKILSTKQSFKNKCFY
jgi:hypothetical protein